MATSDDTLPPLIETALQGPSLDSDERLPRRRRVIELLGPHAARLPDRAPRAYPRTADDGQLSPLAQAALRDPTLPADERMAVSRRLAELLHGCD